MSTAGGDMGSALTQMTAMVLQTVIYLATAFAAIYIENWIIRHKEAILEKRDKIAAKVGIDRAEDAKIITGKE